MLTGKTALYDENKKSIGELDIRNYQILELVITLDDFLRADQIFTDNLKDNKTYGSILLMNFADLRKAMGLCKGEKFFEFLNFCERFNGLTTTDGGYLLLLSNFLETNNYYDDYTSADKYDERQYANLEKQLRNVQKSGCSSNQVDGGSS